MSIGRTILNQIDTIDPRARFAWGAFGPNSNTVIFDDSVKFKTSGMVKWKGYVHIKYNAATDLYDIDFFRIRNHEIKMDYQTTDIYAESLVEVIDRRVG